MVLRSLVSAAVIIGIVAPVAATALWRTRGKQKAALASLFVVGTLILADEIILRAPRLAVFNRLEWNWQGKLLEILLGVLAIFIFLISREEAAVIWPRTNWVRPTTFAAMAILALPLAFFVAAHARETLTREGWIFQLTMPGLAEELLFRGVIQGLLNRGLGKPWRIIGSRIGWGWLITAILFAAAHVVSVNRQLQIQLSIEDGVGPLIGGLIAGWLREKTESIWPVVIVHNLGNVFTPVLAVLRPR